jgi:hypothetical protein
MLPLPESYLILGQVRRIYFRSSVYIFNYKSRKCLRTEGWEKRRIALR